MKRLLVLLHVALLLTMTEVALAEVSERVVDLPTRSGVTQRLLFLAPEAPKAAVILFAGGDGELQISPDGGLKQRQNNFLVRNRQTFAGKGLLVALIDAPSDRQRPPFLTGFRETREHVADVKAVIAWLKEQANVPVWLVGTSMGTLSAAFVATHLGASDGGPDGLVLTSTVLVRPRVSPGIRPVPHMPLERLKIPVLVAHHEQDGCGVCAYSDIPRLMEKLGAVPRNGLLSFRGGQNMGDPCESRAYHGFNGLDKDVVGKIAEWIVAK